MLLSECFSQEHVSSLQGRKPDKHKRFWWSQFDCKAWWLMKTQSRMVKVLSLLMLCAPVFIFTSGSSFRLGRTHCGFSIWLSLFAIFTTLYANLFHEKTDKTQEYSKSTIFVRYENGRLQLLGAQSSNSDRASLMKTQSSVVKIRSQLFSPTEL